MPLNLVTGGPGSGKSKVLYDVVRQAAATSVPVVLLPSAPDVRRAQSELLVQQNLVGLLIVQADDYLAALWELHGDGRRIVTPLQRSAIIGAEIGRSQLSQLTASASTRGVRILLERIASLQSAPFSPDGADLGAVVAEVLAGYAGTLRRHGLVELSEATEILGNRLDPGWFDGPLVANHFDDLTQSQENFFTRAAGAGVEVWLAITGGTDSPSTTATSGIIDRLRASAEREMCTGDTRDSSDELVLLQQRLFGSGEALRPTGSVSVSVGYGEDAEAERIVAEVLEVLASGVPPGEIAVIYRDTVRHHAALRRAFAEAGVAADFDVLLKFSQMPFGRAVLALLDFAVTGDRVHLVAFLSSGYAGLRADDVDGLDAIWRRRGRECDAERMLSDLDRVGSRARRFVKDAVRLARDGVNAQNNEKWKDLAGEMLAHAHGANAPRFEHDPADDATAHRKLCQAVDDLLSIGSLEANTIGLREVLMSARMAPWRVESPDRVQVMNAERARGRRFDCVILAGLVEGEFPRTLNEGVLEAGLLGLRLAAQGVALPRVDGPEQERLLFYRSVTRARRRLILSLQAADSDGRPLRPSVLLEDVYAAYGASFSNGTVLPRRTLAFADLGLHESAPSLPRRALRTVALSQGGDDLPQVARARSRSSAVPKRISDPELLETLARKTVFSATELETYARCPYSWFYTRFLRPQALTEENEALLGGDIAHRALRDFYTALPETLGHARVTSANLGECLAFMDSVFANSVARRLRSDCVGHRVLGGVMRDHVRRLIERDAMYLPGFVPDLHEWAFGFDDAEAQDLGGFLLKGRVDRVDFAGDRFVVVDYKTRHATPAAHFESEGVLHAPLYAEVVRRRTGKRIAGTFYRSLAATVNAGMNRGAYDAEAVSGPELVANDAKQPLDEVIARAIERARAAVDGIRSGSIAPAPVSERACRYCGADSWCKEALS